jgi:hypothetical protein
MHKKRAEDKGRTVRVGATPVTSFTPEQQKKLRRLVRNRLMRDRNRRPKVRGKVVNYIRHSIDHGTLSVTVFFRDKTALSLRYACEMFAVEAGLSNWKSGNMEMIHGYLKPIPT